MRRRTMDDFTPINRLKSKQCPCPECGEMLRWFEIDQDGKCPICEAIVDPDKYYQGDLFPREIQEFIK